MSATSRDYLLSLEQIGIKLGLEQIRALLAALAHPELDYPSIIVAGTNGKGSVTAMVERGLRAAGYRTGRYTSPHLVHLEERVAIDGRAISAATLDASLARVRDAARQLAAPPTFFEATTALALDVFRDSRVDVAVLEVGLGGRLDATNAVDCHVAAITAIDFDHEQYFGNTIEAIAGEKAGVIKPGSHVVLANNRDAVRHVVASKCEDVGATLAYADDAASAEAEMQDGRARVHIRTASADYGEITLALRGQHQIANAVTAVLVLESLGARILRPVPTTAIRAALEHAEWPARLELLRWHRHDVLVDGAHNPAGARALASYISETYDRRVPIVFGAMRDKNLEGLIQALAPSASAFVFTAPAMPRAAAPTDLLDIARRVVPDTPATAIPSPLDALTRACELGTPAVVGGSLFLAGEIRAILS